MEENQVTKGARLGSMFLDHFFMCFILAMLVMPFMAMDFDKSLNDESLNTTSAIDWTLIIMTCAMSLYFNKDIFQGKSIAKRIVKQQIIDIKTNEVASPIKCLIRNITIPIWIIEVIVVLFSPSRRIGDFIAGTKVINAVGLNNSNPPVNFKNVFVAFILGLLIMTVLAFSFMGHNKSGFVENTTYVESSFNEELSLMFESKLVEQHPEFLEQTNIKVFDKVANDSIKYVHAVFSLAENFMENEEHFEEIQKIIFNTMFEVIPKGEFVLHSKFLYDGKSIKKSVEQNYDWRN